VTDEPRGYRLDAHRVESRTPVPPDAIVSFELVLRYPIAHQIEIDAQTTRLLSGVPSVSTRDPAVAAARRADPADIERVRTVAAHAGFNVESVDMQTRSMHLSGEAHVVNRWFGITLMECRAGSTSWRDYDGELQIPAALRPLVEAILGVSTSPSARSHQPDAVSRE
jgi:hypothetical protein